VIDARLDPGGDHGLQPAVESLFQLLWIVFECGLTPVQCFLASDDKAESARNGAVIGNGEVSQASQGVRRVGLVGRNRHGTPIGALTDTGCAGMLPMHGLKGAHLFAGIEDNLFAVDGENDDVIVKLSKEEVARLEIAAVAIAHFHVVSGETCGAGHGDVEKSDVLPGTAFLRPGVFSPFGGAEAELLDFRLTPLAGEVSIIECLDGLVDLFRLVEIRISWSNQTGHGIVEGLGGLGKVINFPGPELGF
jgi:hypothetical protein